VVDAGRASCCHSSPASCPGALARGDDLRQYATVNACSGTTPARTARRATPVHRRCAAATARRVPRWERVCGRRHGRWLLDADADQPLEHLNLRGARTLSRTNSVLITYIQRAGGVRGRP
jgi:hypothetical protein